MNGERKPNANTSLLLKQADFNPPKYDGEGKERGEGAEKEYLNLFGEREKNIYYIYIHIYIFKHTAHADATLLNG